MLIEQRYPAEALIFAERAKGRVLLDVLGVGKLNITKAMTDEDQQQEHKPLAEVFALNTQIQRETARQKPDESRLADLKSGLQKARLQYEPFRTDLYAIHPELKVQRGETPPHTLKESGALIPGTSTALLEFVVMEDKTLVFVLTKGKQQQDGTPNLSAYTLN